VKEEKADDDGLVVGWGMGKEEEQTAQYKFEAWAVKMGISI
jgi:hypothetical protein